MSSAVSLLDQLSFSTGNIAFLSSTEVAGETAETSLSPIFAAIRESAKLVRLLGRSPEMLPAWEFVSFVRVTSLAFGLTLLMALLK